MRENEERWQYWLDHFSEWITPTIILTIMKDNPDYWASIIFDSSSKNKYVREWLFRAFNMGAETFRKHFTNTFEPTGQRAMNFGAIQALPNVRIRMLTPRREETSINISS